MLIHPWDAGCEDDGWRFAAAQGFGHFIAGGREREVPVVVPTQFVLEATDGRPNVLLHFARPNPVWRALAENPHALLSVAGDWSYIPSSWKAVGDEDPALGIPTTYYAAVQLIGRVELVDDPDDLAALLRAQLAVVQPNGGHADPAAAHARLLSTIRGVRLVVAEIRTKLKYGGNVDDEHAESVARHLVERAGPGDAAALARLRDRLG
jgi:transcriptional regulator